MTGLNKTSAFNMDCWLKGVYMPEKLTYRVQNAPGLEGTFKATCLDMEGHATYGPSMQDALDGCIRSVKNTCFRKLRNVIAELRENLPDDEDPTEIDMYNVPRWWNVP